MCIFTKGKRCCESNTIIDKSNADFEDRDSWSDYKNKKNMNIYLSDTVIENDDSEKIPRR